MLNNVSLEKIMKIANNLVVQYSNKIGYEMINPDMNICITNSSISNIEKYDNNFRWNISYKSIKALTQQKKDYYLSCDNILRQVLLFDLFVSYNMSESNLEKNNSLKEFSKLKKEKDPLCFNIMNMFHLMDIESFINILNPFDRMLFLENITLCFHYLKFNVINMIGYVSQEKIFQCYNNSAMNKLGFFKRLHVSILKRLLYNNKLHATNGKIFNSTLNNYLKIIREQTKSNIEILK